jgi:hypothetical protein
MGVCNASQRRSDELPGPVEVLWKRTCTHIRICVCSRCVFLFLFDIICCSPVWSRCVFLCFLLLLLLFVPPIGPDVYWSVCFLWVCCGIPHGASFLHSKTQAICNTMPMLCERPLLLRAMQACGIPHSVVCLNIVSHLRRSAMLHLRYLPQSNNARATVGSDCFASSLSIVSLCLLVSLQSTRSTLSTCGIPTWLRSCGPASCA